MRLLDKWNEARGRGSDSSAAVVVPWLASVFSPKRVVDVGCGDGSWLAEFKRAGCEVRGFDRQLPTVLDCAEFGLIDLNRGAPGNAAADLVLCLEVAEHLKPERAEPLVEALVKIAPVAVFSAAVPCQGGLGHRNERWQSYWVELFGRRGRLPFDDLRTYTWNLTPVSPWYRQNTLIYASEADGKRFDLRPCELLDVVHPATFEHVGPMAMAQRVRRLLKPA